MRSLLDAIVAGFIETLERLLPDEQMTVLDRLTRHYGFCTRCGAKCAGWCDHDTGA